MKPAFLLAAAIAALGLAIPFAQAQYTPGGGGVYVAPTGSPGIYVPPSTPSVPSPQPTLIMPPPSTPSTPAAVIVQPPAMVVPQLSDAQMADLTASVALYPDPLLAEVLPAATYVEELAFADKWLEQHPGATEPAIATLPLHDDVKAIMHYPTVLNLLTDHLDWTQAMGTAFLYQRNDLMESVQRWRATAIAYGTLYTTPQQQVIQQGAVVVIQPPPNVQVIYVPVYDPAIVFVRPRVGPPPRDAIRFAAGGFSLTFISNDLDWHDHVVRVPVHHDDPDYRGSGGRTTVVDTKTVFVHDTAKPVALYPQKIVTPTPDKKVVSIPTPPTDRSGGPGGSGRGPGGGGPGGIGPGGGGPGGGGRDGNPGTPFCSRQYPP